MKINEIPAAQTFIAVALLIIVGTIVWQLMFPLAYYIDNNDTNIFTVIAWAIVLLGLVVMVFCWGFALFIGAGLLLMFIVCPIQTTVQISAVIVSTPFVLFSKVKRSMKKRRVKKITEVIK